jgi:hypothetical protein
MKVEPADAEGSKGGGGAGHRAVGRALAGPSGGHSGGHSSRAPTTGQRGQGRGVWVDMEEGGPVPFKEVWKTRDEKSQWRMPLSGPLGQQVCQLNAHRRWRSSNSAIFAL